MKKCILYENRVCNDCGECLVCDLDPNKLCDNCGKCIEPGDDREFLSMIVHADDDDAKAFDESSVPLSDEDFESLSDEEKQLIAFLDAPIDLNVPEPIQIDQALYEKWERILASDTKGADETHSELNVKKSPASYGIRNRRRR